MKRLATLAIACATLVTATSCRRSLDAETPNVLLVVLDTTRADLLSAYGETAPTSPNLARLASEGALFTRAYSTDFWTLPSHASLLTGHYPSEHGATSETNRLSDGALTLAERLHAEGFRTAAFVSNPWMSRENGFAQGFEAFEEMWRGQVRRGFADHSGVQRAASFVGERVAAKEPFFLFLNLNWAHLPYAPEPLVLHEVAPKPRSTARTRELKKVVGTWEYLAGAYELEDADFEILRDLYRGELRTVDGFLGELVDALEEQDVLDETLVIVTSDHGENLGDHGLIDHMLSMYDTTVRVPLVMRFPARIAPGTRIDHLASLVDVVATILDVTGLDPPSEGPGHSLLAGPAPERPFVVAENDRPLNGIRLLEAGFPDFDTTTIDGRMRMIRTERHKLIWHEGSGTELYDLDADPNELHDLSGERPELLTELTAHLEAWMAERAGDRPLGDAPTLHGDEEAREQLRALGYIE